MYSSTGVWTKDPTGSVQLLYQLSYWEIPIKEYIYLKFNTTDGALMVI